jgi:hypothetical protein
MEHLKKWNRLPPATTFEQMEDRDFINISKRKSFAMQHLYLYKCMADTDLMAWGINVVNAEVMKEQRSCIWVKEEALETRHVCVKPNKQ